MLGDKETSEDGHQLNTSLQSQSLSQVHSSTKQNSSPTSDRGVLPCSADTNSEEDLSVSVSSISASVTTPVEVLTAIWKKASELIHEPNSVVVAPGHGEHARMVKSYSGSRPHLVIRKKNGQYACDNNCPNWRSMSICAHSVAAAEANSELYLFVKWFSTTKKLPNLTKLTTTEMPIGRGRKGTRAPPKKKKRTESHCRIPFSTVAHLKRNDLELDHNATTSHDSPSTSTTRDTSSELFSIPARNRKESPQSLPLSIRSQKNKRTMDPLVTYASGSNVIMTGGQLNLHSPEVTYHDHTLPLAPPPLIHYSPESPNVSPFTLVFITGNIRVCRGCRQHYPKPTYPPLDLCVRHKEWLEFTGASGDTQARYGNAYYHCNLHCIRAKWSNFESEMLQISAIMLAQMLPVHTEYLTRHMPGRL